MLARYWALVCFLVAFTVGVACCCRRACFRFDLLYFLERNRLVNPVKGAAAGDDDAYFTKVHAPPKKMLTQVALCIALDALGHLPGTLFL